MAINASVLAGSTGLMAMTHPFVGPTSPYDKSTGNPVGGVPIMIDVRTREVIAFDPWLLKKAEIIHSAFGIVLGPKGHGKSSLMKIIANRLSLLTAGYDLTRITINDYKPEGSSSEYALFTKHMGSKPFAIASMKVNPFEARLFVAPDKSVHDQAILRIAEILFEFANGAPATGADAEAVRTSVAMMLRYDEALWSPALLFNCLRSINDEDIDRYQTDLKNKLIDEMSRRLDLAIGPGSELHEDTIGQIVSIRQAGSNLQRNDIKQAGMFMSQQLGNILHGSYGSMFGSDHSLHDMLTQRAATLDWRGVGDKAEALMRIILTEIKVAAIETNRHDLLPHIELDDEKHKSMSNLVYARSHSHFSEIGRGVHTCNLSATHRLGSIRHGGVGSELYGLGNTIIDNLGFAFIGKHEATDPGLAEICERYSLSRADQGIIPVLPKYTFGIKLGSQQRIRYGRVFALPSEMGFLGTDSATSRMTDRPGVIHPEQLARFAQENGIVYIGANDSS